MMVEEGLILEAADDQSAVAFYLDLAPEELVDLEVAASAAIEWARGIKAAATALDASYDYRVTLIAAEPGSSKWLARLERARDVVEQSSANQALEQARRGWQRVPLILRLIIALAVVVPTTAKPTFEYWTGSEDFNEKQLKQLEETFKKVQNDASVKAQRQSVYREVQRDRKITAVGGGVPKEPKWKPEQLIPSSQFAEADGLFNPQPEVEHERTVPSTLDVILITPRLENTPRTWTFRQEGIPGTINAVMKDKRFLAALDRSAIRENLRANIPMRIRLEIKQRLVDGEWRVTKRGRSVVEVISPQIE